MTTNEFWEIIDRARADDADCEAVVAGVRSALESLSSDGVLGFERELELRMIESYRWDLWAVACIANGGCSDAGFDYFRGWLITKGRSYFEAALSDPQRAVDAAVFDENECEDMISVAASVYEEKTGEYPPRSNAVRPKDPVGKAWEEDELSSLYPELCERFS